MGKSKRSMNPADALRKKQRKRELKKNKEDRKRVRESALAKKDVGKVRQEIARLEHLSNMGQLDKAGQTRLDQLKSDIGKIEKAKKATELTGAQAAYVARMQEQEKKHEGEARKLVYDPKRGAFVPAKIKEKSSSASTKEADDEDNSSSSDSSSDDDSSDESDQSEDDISLDEEEEESKEEEIALPPPKTLTESDDEYEIPLPPGPPPYRPFEEQLNPIIQHQFRNPPPPPPPGGPVMNRPRMHQVPPPPPPIPYGFRPPQMMAAPPPPPPIMPYQQISAPVYYPQPPPQSQSESGQQRQTSQTASTPVISAEPQLRDLEKETLAFVPAAIRRKQNAANKKASLPKEARPHIDAAP
ncbi:hypothetical protein [Parasitella parasitica]|uniref:Wbp11/ELF5/Saf1 N-terminal domain-containing protein n=1 Tax=Parasitella parasitica TaxID=35722 RepID=A0A0B7NH18_9FUNG|nr:hypothetical protein [Parasitella parasitica]